MEAFIFQTLRNTEGGGGGNHKAGLAAHGVQVGHGELVHTLNAQVHGQLVQGLAHARIDVVLPDPPLRTTAHIAPSETVTFLSLTQGISDRDLSK